MNTRLQVEHPVTEAITGLDLVELQFRVAAGEMLPFAPGRPGDRRPRRRGAALCRGPGEGVSCRRPASSGRLQFPDGRGRPHRHRASRQGDEVTPFYDPMIAKVIAHGATRDEALDRLSRGARGDARRRPEDQRRLPEEALRRAEGFRAGRFDTGFIDANLEALGGGAQPLDEEAARLGALMLIDDEWETSSARRSSLAPAEGLTSPWSERDGFELGPPRQHGLSVAGRGPIAHDMSVSAGRPPAPRSHSEASVVALRPGRISSTTTARFPARRQRSCIVLRERPPDARRPATIPSRSTSSTSTRAAPSRRRCTASSSPSSCKPGDRVEKGQRLAIVEAMKMEHALVAPADRRDRGGRGRARRAGRRRGAADRARDRGMPAAPR